jgi:hypothetical protein
MAIVISSPPPIDTSSSAAPVDDEVDDKADGRARVCVLLSAAAVKEGSGCDHERGRSSKLNTRARSAIATLSNRSDVHCREALEPPSDSRCGAYQAPTAIEWLTSRSICLRCQIWSCVSCTAVRDGLAPSVLMAYSRRESTARHHRAVFTACCGLLSLQFSNSSAEPVITHQTLHLKYHVQPEVRRHHRQRQ